MDLKVFKSKVIVDRVYPKNPKSWEKVISYDATIEGVHFQYIRRTLKTVQGVVKFNKYRVDKVGMCKRKFFNVLNKTK